MKTVFVVMDEEVDWVPDGDGGSVGQWKTYPSLVFESITDAEAYIVAEQKRRGVCGGLLSMLEVNCYAPGEWK